MSPVSQCKYPLICNVSFHYPGTICEGAARAERAQKASGQSLAKMGNMLPALVAGSEVERVSPREVALVEFGYKVERSAELLEVAYANMGSVSRFNRRALRIAIDDLYAAEATGNFKQADMSARYALKQVSFKAIESGAEREQELRGIVSSMPKDPDAKSGDKEESKRTLFDRFDDSVKSATKNLDGALGSTRDAVRLFFFRIFRAYCRMVGVFSPKSSDSDDLKGVPCEYPEVCGVEYHRPGTECKGADMIADDYEPEDHADSAPSAAGSFETPKDRGKAKPEKKRKPTKKEIEWAEYRGRCDRATALLESVYENSESISGFDRRAGQAAIKDLQKNLADEKRDPRQAVFDIEYAASCASFEDVEGGDRTRKELRAIANMLREEIPPNEQPKRPRKPRTKRAPKQPATGVAKLFASARNMFGGLAFRWAKRSYVGD